MWFLTQEAGFASVQRGRYLPILPCLPAQSCWLPFHLAICHLWPGWAKLLLNTDTNNSLRPHLFVKQHMSWALVCLWLWEKWFVLHWRHIINVGRHVFCLDPTKVDSLRTEVMQPFCKKLRRLQFINANCTIKDKNILFKMVCDWLPINQQGHNKSFLASLWACFLLATHNSFYPTKRQGVSCVWMDETHPGASQLTAGGSTYVTTYCARGHGDTLFSPYALPKTKHDFMQKLKHT